MARNQLRNNQIADSAINNAKIASDAGIDTSKLADGAEFLKRDGSVALTNNLPAGGNKITGLADPTSAQDSATKAYVDATIEGLSPKESARVATTANITLSGEQTIDGVSVVAGNRVLVKNQTAQAENGIYIVASGAWSRSADANTWDKLVSAALFVEEGSVNADKKFLNTANRGGTLGTTAVTFVIFGEGPSGLEAGDFVTQETPTGAVNGSNVSFSLANTPVSGSETVYRNGQVQEPGSGNDYTISGATITYEYAPASGEQIRVSYIVS